MEPQLARAVASERKRCSENRSRAVTATANYYQLQEMRFIVFVLSQIWTADEDQLDQTLRFASALQTAEARARQGVPVTPDIVDSYRRFLLQVLGFWCRAPKATCEAFNEATRSTAQQPFEFPPEITQTMLQLPSFQSQEEP